MSSPVRTSNPSSLADPTPFAYAHTATVAEGSRLIYIAGQVGLTKGGTVSDDFSLQAQQAFENVRACLRDAGATIRNIVHMTTAFIYPSGAIVPVPALALPSLKIEIQCVAAIRPKSALASRPRAQPSIMEMNVVVVGAGLSGLQAATDVQNSGLSCVVLEAKKRVGGKTQAVKVASGTGILDLGAAWINSQTQPKIWALLQQFGMEPIVQRAAGDEVFRDGKTPSTRTAWPNLPFSDEERKRFELAAVDMDRDSKWINIHDSTLNSHIKDISLADYLHRKSVCSQPLELWRTWIRALTGTEPENIGLVYWLDYIKSAGGVESLISDGPKGAQYMTNRRGNLTPSFF